MPNSQEQLDSVRAIRKAAEEANEAEMIAMANTLEMVIRANDKATEEIEKGGVETLLKRLCSYPKILLNKAHHEAKDAITTMEKETGHKVGESHDSDIAMLVTTWLSAFSFGCLYMEVKGEMAFADIVPKMMEGVKLADGGLTPRRSSNQQQFGGEDDD